MKILNNFHVLIPNILIFLWGCSSPSEKNDIVQDEFIKDEYIKDSVIEALDIKVPDSFPDFSAEDDQVTDLYFDEKIQEDFAEKDQENDEDLMDMYFDEGNFEDEFTDISVDEAISDDWAGEEISQCEKIPKNEGCPCKNNDECINMKCIATYKGNICAPSCSATEKCPDDFECKSYGIGSDIVYICIPLFISLCKPCNAASECEPEGTCLSYGDDGSFCASECYKGEKCPEGFVCEELDKKYCMLEDESCPCSDNSVKNSLWTECFKENTFGKCEGKRVCTSGGLSDCDAEEAKMEVCNGKDDDCDGLTDEEGAWGCINYFKDADGDGFGNPNGPKCLCAPDPEKKYISNSEDCDDTDPEVNPNAIEMCNDKDDDCDGDANELYVPGCTMRYFDGDGDGYYAEGALSECRCKPKGLYTAIFSGDCDDSKTNVNPGGKETCYTDYDDDCNPANDNGPDIPLCTKWYFDDDNDGYYVQDAGSKCLCKPEGKYTGYITGECNDTNPAVNPSASETCATEYDDDCNPANDNNENLPQCKNWYFEEDGDGYYVNGADYKCRCKPEGKYTGHTAGDCDDTNPAVNPSAVESCFTIYNDNCDEDANDLNAAECITRYYDNDSDDYYADDALSECRCTEEGKFTADPANSGDCDDSDFDLKPSAQETCDGIDNNCNDEIDENACSYEYYCDHDEDGHIGEMPEYCDTFECIPSGCSENAGTDCNDDDKDIYPGAVERCSTEYDDNCNDETNEKDANDCVNYYFDDDDDGYGTEDYECMCDPEGKYRAQITGDCKDSDELINPGMKENCGTSYDDNCNDKTDDAWSLFLLDSDGFTGAFSSLKVDSNNKAHISFVDQTEKTLKYATNETGSWVYSVVDSSGQVTDGTSIALDENNRVYISYYSLNEEAGNLKHASNASGSWISVTVDTGKNAGTYSSVAVDSKGYVHISYRDEMNKTLKYASDESGGWITYTVDLIGDAGSYTSLGIDTKNKLHISYRDNTNKDLKYATNGSGVWIFTTVDSSENAGTDTAIAVDANDKVHISYRDITNTALKYVTDASGSWLVLTIDSSSDAGNDTSIAVDASGRVHISYSNNATVDPRYATNASGSWIIMTVDSAGNTGIHTAIALDLSGRPHISYHDLTNGDLKYAVWMCPETCEVPDSDDDGYDDVFCGGTDCNDKDKDVNPGAKENCGTWYDDNCNNDVNEKDTENCVKRYYDNDGDGYGIDDSECRCKPQGKYTALLTGDCDDSDPVLNPGNIEICDGLDNNCNSDTDEGCDDDNDDYCQKDMIVIGVPFTCMSGGEDCDDDNPDVNEGVIESTASGNCTNNLDDDCDGLTDMNDPGCS